MTTANVIGNPISTQPSNTPPFRFHGLLLTPSSVSFSHQNSQLDFEKFVNAAGSSSTRSKIEICRFRGTKGTLEVSRIEIQRAQTPYRLNLSQCFSGFPSSTSGNFPQPCWFSLCKVKTPKCPHPSLLGTRPNPGSRMSLTNSTWKSSFPLPVPPPHGRKLKSVGSREPKVR